MNRFRNKLSDSDDHNRTLKIVTGVLLVVVVYLMALYWDAKESRSFIVPPDLRQGVVMRANDVAPSVVYSFAFYIFQQLNRWPEDGEKDYSSNIYYLQSFLTPSFREELIRQGNRKQKRGELRKRVRSIQEVHGRGYEGMRVEIESNNSWIVWIDVEIDETLHGEPVKRVSVQYSMRVVRYDVDPESNPWGLAIAGYNGVPTKMDKSDLQQEFKRIVQ